MSKELIILINPPSLVCRKFVMMNGDGGRGLVREERLQIMLSPEELVAVDNFRFEHRMPSRAAAVRELLRLGIANAKVATDNAGILSRDYGVLKAPKRKRTPASGIVS